MKPKFQFGFDIGSISINTVVMDAEGKVCLDRYDYNHGKPFEKLKEILEMLANKEISQEEAERMLKGN